MRRLRHSICAVFVRITNEAAITTKRAGKKISDLDATDSGWGEIVNESTSARPDRLPQQRMAHKASVFVRLMSIRIRKFFGPSRVRNETGVSTDYAVLVRLLYFPEPKDISGRAT